MKFNYKEVYEKIHNISGLSLEDTKLFFESLFIYTMLNYLEKEPTYFPNVGKVKFNYIGEQYSNGTNKKARVDFEFEPDDYLLKNIGQAEDGDETDIEKKFKERIGSVLVDIVEG